MPQNNYNNGFQYNQYMNNNMNVNQINNLMTTFQINNNQYLNSSNQNNQNNLNNQNNQNNQSLKELNITEEEIKKLIEDRNRARREQNFLEADRIRDFLKQKGIALMDEKGGRGKGTEVTTWRICKPFFPGKNNDVFFNNDNANNNYSNKRGF